MQKPIRRRWGAIWLVAVVLGLSPLPRPLAAQQAALPSERDLHLEYIGQSWERKSHPLAINAKRQRGYSASRDGTRGGMRYGLRYESDEIILYPNRLPPGPGYTKRAIDRKDLALTYFQPIGIDTPERIVVGTAQRREITPVPGLMPGDPR
ncbi:hypothetical protein [Erythrobacter tepidarius]|uniref:hypothetical protein n=1 Tax=Erythrobacter tepidarius TaxID=60454 RepID=UPI000A3AC335|nr:hypothetical protein [Erythrobacter tepidarius]